MIKTQNSIWLSLCKKKKKRENIEIEYAKASLIVRRFGLVNLKIAFSHDFVFLDISLPYFLRNIEHSVRYVQE